jgi:uncharacterized protein
LVRAQEWSKDQQRGIYQPHILIIRIVALGLIEIEHRSSAGRCNRSFDIIPCAALLGTWCGITMFRRLTDLQFGRLVNMLLILSGIGLPS